jgi:ATP-binding cassette subfamily B protein
MLDWPNTLSAIEVLPSLPSDTHIAQRLLYFTYGEAKKQGSIFFLVTVVGLVLGFIFSIGRQVGAARWIAGMGIMGALLGGSLALLSNSLRLPLIAAFLSALVGLLVPTINTLLTNTALPEKDLSLMLQLGALFLAAAISDIGLRWTEARTLLTAQEKGEHRLELAALQHLLRLPMSFFNKFRVGDLSLRFAAIAGAQNEIRSLISSGALQSILSVIYLLFMLRISPRLTLLTAVLALLLVIPVVLIGRKCLQLERRREEVFAESNNRNIELIGSVTKLRMAGAESEAQAYWWSSFANSIRFQYEVDKRLALVSIVPIVMPNLGLLLLFIVISGIASEAATNPSLKTPNIGQLLGFLSAFSTFIAAMSSVGLLIVQAFELPVLIDRAQPILLCQEESVGDSIDPGIINGKIDFLNVSFRYRDSGPWILDCINLSIKAGEFVAIVGPTGSGKTTITRLLLRLESPQQGNILLDDKPLEKIRIDALRQQMGVVTQNSSLLAGSIFDVIAGGRLIDIETALFAAEAASLGDDIRALPMGMNTIIPEGGAWLSGGQRQRLAIARSLSRKPRLLVLDEATSSLDNITQMRVSSNLQELGITMLVVAHRLSTVRHADRIIVLENGKIVQDGSFDNLSKTDGSFLALMQNQLEDGLDSGPTYS